jgi:hypothetical protein
MKIYLNIIAILLIACSSSTIDDQFTYKSIDGSENKSFNFIGLGPIDGVGGEMGVGGNTLSKGGSPSVGGQPNGGSPSGGEPGLGGTTSGGTTFVAGSTTVLRRRYVGQALQATSFLSYLPSLSFIMLTILGLGTYIYNRKNEQLIKT